MSSERSDLRGGRSRITNTLEFGELSVPHSARTVESNRLRGTWRLAIFYV